jgi:hypothetical protein
MKKRRHVFVRAERLVPHQSLGRRSAPAFESFHVDAILAAAGGALVRDQVLESSAPIWLPPSTG